METLATEIDATMARERMAFAIARLEGAIGKLRAKESARNQIIEEMDNCISSLEQLLNNSKEK